MRTLRPTSTSREGAFARSKLKQSESALGLDLVGARQPNMHDAFSWASRWFFNMPGGQSLVGRTRPEALPKESEKPASNWAAKWSTKTGRVPILKKPYVPHPAEPNFSHDSQDRWVSEGANSYANETPITSETKPIPPPTEPGRHTSIWQWSRPLPPPFPRTRGLVVEKPEAQIRTQARKAQRERPETLDSSQWNEATNIVVSVRNIRPLQTSQQRRRRQCWDEWGLLRGVVAFWSFCLLARLLPLLATNLSK